MLVPFEALKLGPNFRVFVTGIAELASDIDSTQWVEPLTVTEENDVFVIHAGQRRYLAIEKLREKNPEKWKEVPVQIIETDDEIRLFEIKAKENLKRKSFRIYEIMQICEYAADELSLTPAETAERLGYSKTHIENILRIRKQASPELLEKLRQGADIKQNTLLMWLKLNHQQQNERLQTWLGRQSQQVGKRRQRKMIPYYKAEEFLRTLERKKMTTSVGAAVQTARYLMGLKKDKPRL